MCAAEESTCFELICKRRISSYGNISQSSDRYLGQFPFYVRLLESLLENAADCGEFCVVTGISQE